jgi:iron complex outermembrane receptor protein
MIGSAYFEQVRERKGGLLDIQLRPSDTIDVGFNAFVSKQDAANYNRNYLLWVTHFLAQGNGQAPLPGYVVRNGTLVNANFAGVPGTTYGVYDQISRPDSSADSQFLSWDATWRASDKLTFKGQAGMSWGTGQTPTQDVAEWNVGIGSGGGWGLNGVGAADWHIGGNTTSPAGNTLGWIFGYQDVKVEDQEDWVKLDGEYFIDSAAMTSLQFGLRYAEHSRESKTATAQGPGCIDAGGNVVPFDWSQANWCPVGTTSPADPANFPSGFANYPGDFGGGLGGSFPRDIWYYSPEQLAEFNRLTNRNPVERSDWLGIYGIREKTTAGYVQLNLEGERWSGNVGVRLVKTEDRITNNVAASANTPGAITSSAFGPYLPVVTEHTYNHVLPSFNFKYDINEDLVTRFAASRTMTRPDYSALAGAVSLSPPASPGAQGSGSGGNPDLEPVISTNLDATLEWYFAPRALLAASLFYMDLDNYVAYGQVTRQFMTYSTTYPQGFLADYVLSVPVNTGGKVQGIELTYEQPIGENFGISANFTYADSETDDGSDLVGTSKNTYNLSGYYENDVFSARINYTARSSFYSGLDRATAFYQDDVDNVSASLGYKATDWMSITLDAQNLNNPKLKYYALNKDQPRSIYENGRQYYLNFRFKF